MLRCTVSKTSKPTNLLMDKVGRKAPYSKTGKSNGFHHNPDMAGNRKETY
jgi:hypothetical protein